MSNKTKSILAIILIVPLCIPAGLLADNVYVAMMLGGIIGVIAAIISIHYWTKP